MPDSFFATQKQRKRKRSTTGEGPSTSKKHARSVGGKPSTHKGKKSGHTSVKSKRTAGDEELSDETHDEDEGAGVDEMDLRAPDVDPNAYESGEEDDNETPAEKRLRLAKLYLDGVKEGLGLADGEFDAAEIDRELISARLKQDVLEHSGKVHLWVADSYDFSNPPILRTRGHKFSVTAAVASDDARWLYTSGKDGWIIKWDLHTGRRVHTFFKVRPTKDSQNGKGKGKAKADPSVDIPGHTDEIWGLALSPDGRYLASAGKDKRVGIWDVEKQVWVKAFGGHRDSVSAVAFRKTSATASSNTATQLYTGSYDRTIKLFDLTTMGYVETLFGHQAPILNLDALMRETAVSVGGRDKSVRFWKIPEESQLVFRGGGKSGWEDILEGGDLDDGMDIEGKEKGKTRPGVRKTEKFVEGSIECVAMLDESTFVSGGDSGSISLWNTQKKKPIFTQALAHGMDESHVDSEDMHIVRKPRWVTALGSLRYSDLFASGSWDGAIRLWKLDSSLKSFSLIGSVPVLGVVNSIQFFASPQSIIDQLSWAPRSPANQVSKSGVSNSPVASKQKQKQQPVKSAVLVAGVGWEMRLGRWVQKKGEGVANGAVVILLNPRTSTGASA